MKFLQLVMTFGVFAVVFAGLYVAISAIPGIHPGDSSDSDSSASDTGSYSDSSGGSDGGGGDGGGGGGD